MGQGWREAGRREGEGRTDGEGRLRSRPSGGRSGGRAGGENIGSVGRGYDGVWDRP